MSKAPPSTPPSLSRAVIVYFVTMAAFTFVGVQLSLVVIANFVAMTLPHVLAHGEPTVSRVDQWHMAEARALPPMPVAKTAAPQEPTQSTSVLAAQLDIAEADDVAARPATTGRRRLALALGMRGRAHESAAAAFNRNFGVIPIASN